MWYHNSCDAGNNAHADGKREAKPVCDVQVDEVAAHATGVSQMQHLHRSGPIRAYLCDHVIGSSVASEVNKHVDALLLYALRNCKLSPAVEQPCHVQEALDGLDNLAAPRAVVVLVQGEGGGVNARSIVQAVNLCKLLQNCRKE